MREDGNEIDRAIVKEAIHIHNHVSDEVFTSLPCERINSGKIITVAPLIYDLLEREICQINEDDEYKKDLRRAFNAILNHDRFHEGDELEKVTWEKNMDEYNIPPGGDVHIPRGYVQILNYLIKPIAKTSLKLCCEVVKINWRRGENKSVLVENKNGSKYEADHVIVTCSIGYLKKHHAMLFNPNLPEQKSEVIQTLGIGRVNKIFLEFDCSVLAPTYSSIAFAWDDTDIGKTYQNWYKRIFGFDQIFTKNNTVVGWIAGDAAEHMESLTDTEIGKICTQLLRKFLKNENIPNPKSILVSRWCSDTYALGTYYYQTKNMIPGEQKILSEPLKSCKGVPIVMFAGEALTNCCTHGARDSGLQEAERLIKLYEEVKLVSKM